MSSNAILGNPLVKDLLICSLCTRFFEEPRVLPCQHTFCLGCLQQQFQTSHASSRVRLSSIRCPSCFSSAAIPIRGINSFPTDHKVEKVKELVEGVMMTGILRKQRVDVLEGRPRSGSKSRPSSWTGNIDVLAEGIVEDFNKSFPGAQADLMKANNHPQTREVSTDTNDDCPNLETIENDTENCSNLQDCGIQTEICDITKSIEYDKVNKQGYNNDEMDINSGRKRARDIKFNQNGVSHIKRSCPDSDTQNVHEEIYNYESGNKTTTSRLGESSSDFDNMNHDKPCTVNGGENEVYNGVGPNVKSVSKEDQSELRSDYHTQENYMDTSSQGPEDCDNTLQDENNQLNGDINSEDTASLQEEAEKLPPVFTNKPSLLWKVETQEYNMPTSVAMTSNGNVIVSEYGNCKLQFYESDGNYLQSVDELKPFALAIDKEDNIIVGDRKDKTIKVYHSLGEPYYEWEKNSFHWISGVGVTSQGYYVIFDREDCKIGVFTPEGDSIHQFGHYGDRDSQLCMADFLTVDSNDRILVCDSGHHCIKMYDINGSFIGRFGERGSGDGHLLWPKSICLDASDNILVSDQKNSRINVYSPDGRFIQAILTTCISPFSLGFKKPNTLAVTDFALTGHSAISLYQL